MEIIIIFQLLHDASLRLGKDLDKLMLRSLDTLTEAILEKASSSSVMSDSTLCRQLKVIINGTVEEAQQAGRLRTRPVPGTRVPDR